MKELEVSWVIAPSWANFLAMDSDGSCYWYDSRPYLGHGIWVGDCDCQWDFAFRSSIDPINWKKSIFQRPSLNV